MQAPTSAFRVHMALKRNLGTINLLWGAFEVPGPLGLTLDPSPTSRLISLSGKAWPHTVPSMAHLPSWNHHIHDHLHDNHDHDEIHEYDDADINEDADIHDDQDIHDGDESHNDDI